ncbi:MAG: cysteine peptidase family C39 domain-containing protein [Dehalococcoidales bacterium]|nr:cysteine peptidase family C39 domain-containing protein [Dehalococcoidales bacterium]
MINLPSVRQTFDYDCGAKALQTVMAYYGVEVREDELMAQLGCISSGTSPKKMISLAEKKGFEVKASCGTSLATVRKYVDEETPVIVLLQAWADRYMTNDDWKVDNDDGHYAIIVWYINNIIVFEDPSSFRRTYLTEDELIARWHDVDPATQERFDQFAMVLRGKQPASKKMEHMD